MWARGLVDSAEHVDDRLNADLDGFERSLDVPEPALDVPEPVLDAAQPVFDVPELALDPREPRGMVLLCIVQRL